MLLHREKTKRITLSPKTDQPNTTIWHLSQERLPPSPIKLKSGINRSKSNGNLKSRKGNEEKLIEEVRPSFFYKKDKHARKSRPGEGVEEVVDFEIASASGVGSPDGSPDENGFSKSHKNEEKWMGQLINFCLLCA